MKNITTTLLTVAIAAFFAACELDSGHGGSNASFDMVSFGNPVVSRAVEDPSVGIHSLHINGRSGCSWGYTGDIGAAWGVAKGDETKILAVGGWETADGKWMCGKFDWCRPSNNTRDFKNVNSHYNGFDPEAFYSAKRRCFFLMAADGKKRTNIITD